MIERKWIAVREVNLAGEKPSHRIVHFSDLHYKGNRPYLQRVVGKINELSADFVCFTGDIVESKPYLGEALQLLKEIRFPVFGVPGNHDYWSGASFDEVVRSFKATGGAWLVDEQTCTADGKVAIIGSAGKHIAFMQGDTAAKRLLLTHYPILVDRLQNEKFDLILAGHSHGGQVRIPFLGAPILPNNVGQYDKGLFRTAAGPLYVNPGIGTWLLPVRFCCRPEITVIEF